MLTVSQIWSLAKYILICVYKFQLGTVWLGLVIEHDLLHITRQTGHSLVNIYGLVLVSTLKVPKK